MFPDTIKLGTDLSKYKNQKVLVMLSGGKDSVCCMALLKEIGVQCEAIHFIHSWDWENSHLEAKRAAAHFQVPLHEFDFTNEFLEIVQNSMDGRPCRHCKPVMYIKTMEFAIQNGFGWICVGDNASDTIVARLSQFEEQRGNANLFITNYLDCIERGIPVSSELKILRPLIYTSAHNVEKYLKQRFGYSVRKNFETGDKYFGYWREGCPIQYTDPGFKHSEKSLQQLRDINLMISDYARRNGYRASYHYPSGVIVTVPQGHETEVRDFLLQAGYQLEGNNGFEAYANKTNCIQYKIECQNISLYYVSSREAFTPLAKRFAERVSANVEKEFLELTPFGIFCLQRLMNDGCIFYRTEAGKNHTHTLVVEIALGKQYSGESLKHIAFEVFKAPIIKVHEIC